MAPSTFAALFLALFFAFRFLVAALDMSTAVDQFRPVFEPPDGPLLCGVGPPTTVHWSLDDAQICSYKCTFQLHRCWYFNFKAPPNQPTLCELFERRPLGTEVDPNCIMFRVTLVANK